MRDFYGEFIFWQHYCGYAITCGIRRLVSSWLNSDLAYVQYDQYMLDLTGNLDADL